MKSIFKVTAYTVIILAMIIGVAHAGSSSSTAEQTAEATTVIGDIGSNNQGGGIRYFAPPGEITYPGAPNVFFQQPDETYQTRMKIKDILEYDEDGLTTRAQMNILKSTSTFASKRVMVRSRIKVSELTDDERLDLDVEMPVTYTKVKGMRSVGTITVLSDSKGSISDDVFARVQVEAWKMGGQMMHVKAEGFQRVIRNKGAGIGFTWGGSVISTGQSASTTGVVGAGVTWGNAGLFDHPFIIVHVLVVHPS
jgi:hypothetical protein